MIIPIQRDTDAQDLPLPSYATEGSAGLDLCAAVDADLTLDPGMRALVSTGIRVALPDGYEGQVRPRSGLAWRHGLTLLNSPGTIDSDYRGTIKVILINLGQEPVTIQRGDRIAQLVIAPVMQVIWSSMLTLPEKQRGEGGFGSTGK
ncbi:MAG: dUTP diphosphatase [Janthinobacterium lividum]